MIVVYCSFRQPLHAHAVIMQCPPIYCLYRLLSPRRERTKFQKSPPPVAETLLRTLGTFTTRKNLYIWADATALKLAYFLFQFSH